MSRLYRTLRFILRQAVGLYFFDVRAAGQQAIPDQGPLIFAANHPNSIMDTVLLGVHTERQIRYMARSGLFKNPVVRVVFHRFGVIPIYRRSDGGDTKNNEDSFRKAYEALEEGGCIGIFPEGRNSSERMIQKIKTGTARIALCAEERNDFSLDVRIQPVGLNFEDRDRFLSSVLVRFGEPIDVSEYAGRYESDPRGTVRQLTKRIESDLKDLATHIDDERHHQLVRDIHDIYGRELSREFIGDLELGIDLYQRTRRQDRLARDRSANAPSSELEDRFNLEQRIADAVAYYQRTDPGLVARVRMDIRRYRDHLQQFRIRHEIVEDRFKISDRRREAIKMTAYAIFLGPLAVYGFLNNVVPSWIVHQVTRRQSEEAKVAFAAFCTGLIAFPLFYFLQSWALWMATDHSVLVVAIYLLSLPMTGFFFLRWWRQLLASRDRILSRTLFRTEQNLLVDLERERQTLVDTFDELKQRYLEARHPQRVNAVQERIPETTSPQ